MLDLDKFTKLPGGKWTVGFPDGSGAGEWDGTYTIVADNAFVVVRSGDSFGLGYGITERPVADAVAAIPELLAEVVRLREENGKIKTAAKRACWAHRYQNDFDLPGTMNDLESALGALP